MFIPIEETPNKNTLKFIINDDILAGAAPFTVKKNEVDSSENSHFLRDLFSIDGLKEVFFGQNFISVTKEENVHWNKLKLPIVAVLADYKEQNTPLIRKHTKQLEIADTELISQIKEVLESKVRPAVAQDGGDITFHSYDGGVVYLEMHGACSGCPSATLTLKDGVENLLKYYIPEVVRVESI